MDPRPLSLESIFSLGNTAPAPLVEARAYRRDPFHDGDDLSGLLDRFHGSADHCAFLGLAPRQQARSLRLWADGAYRLVSLSAGGWLVEARTSDLPNYWIPAPATLRRRDEHQRILQQQTATITALDIQAERLEVTFDLPPDWQLDLVVWRIPDDESELLKGLQSLTPLERTAWYLWGSHTVYDRPSALYTHLIGGKIYENRRSWPHYWRICSENDAHALYVVLNGLHQATAKPLYRILKQQLVLSTIARQASDGGWYHGEWTNLFESHYRLHASGMHLLMDHLEEGEDATALEALTKARDFLAGRADHIDAGTWFLHDSLEHSPQAMDQGIAKWIPTRVLGQNPSNMLVLNTHLDTSIALDRSARCSGEQPYQGLLDSAANSTHALLGLCSAEGLYRLLFRIVALTYLPSRKGAALPLPLRALKRLGWKYILPHIPDLKTRFPRLVMPDGYVDRALALRDWSDAYLPINIMDLLRYRRWFPRGQDQLDAIIDRATELAQHSGIRESWAEEEESLYALGFWSEALYQRCLIHDGLEERARLVESIRELEARDMGLPPSLLGGNREAVSATDAHPCPLPKAGPLRVLNLSRPGVREFIAVNLSDEPVTLHLSGRQPPAQDSWRDPEGHPQNPVLEGKAWAISRTANEPHS